MTKPARNAGPPCGADTHYLYLFVIGLARTFPIEAIERDDQTLLPGPPMDIRYLYHRILQVGRSDLEILLVKDQRISKRPWRRLPSRN